MKSLTSSVETCVDSNRRVICVDLKYVKIDVALCLSGLSCSKFLTFPVLVVDFQHHCDFLLNCTVFG